jgi:hypothetical protein
MGAESLLGGVIAAAFLVYLMYTRRGRGLLVTEPGVGVPAEGGRRTLSEPPTRGSSVHSSGCLMK